MSLTVAELKAVFSADMASLDRDIVAIKRKLSSIRGVTARMDVDATEANQRIDKMRRNAERNLGTKVTATADTAAAEAKIDAVARDRTSTVKVNVDDAGFKGLSGLMTTIVGLGPLTVPILAAVTGGVTTLGSALVAGAGAGGVLTASIFGQVKAMVAQQEEIATTQKALDKLRPGTKDYADKLRELHQQQATFTRDFGPAAAGLDHLRTAWSGFLSATRPTTVGLIGKSLDTLASVLPVLPPLANAAGRSVSGLLDDVGAWGQSAQARSFLGFFRREGPDAITALGHASGNFLSGFISIFQAFAPTERGFLDWLERSSRGFSVWASHLSETDGFQGFLEYLQREGPKVADLLGQLVTLGSHTLQAFAPLGSIELSAIIDLVGLVNKIPIPILTMAAAAFTSWALAIKAVNLSAKLLPPSLSGVTKPALSAGEAAAAAATKTARLQQAARTAAGAGGLLLLMDASNRTSGGLKMLEGAAGGALAGFSVGGPWGAAIGGAIGLLGTLGGENRQTAQEVDALTATLDKQTGAITKNSVEWAATKLADKGMIDDVSRLGLSAHDVTQAMLGNKTALADVNGQLDRYAIAVTGGVANGGEMNSANSKINDSLNAMRDLLSETNGEYDAAREKALFVAAAHKDVAEKQTWETLTAKDLAKVSATVTSESRKMGGAVSETAGRLDEQAASTRHARQELEGFQSVAAGVISRQYALAQAIMDSFKAQKEQKDGFDRFTPAGQKNMATMLNLAQATEGFTGTTERGRAAIDRIRTRMIAFAIEQGKSAAGAETLVNRLLGIDAAAARLDNRHIKVTVDQVFNTIGKVLTAVNPFAGKKADGGPISGPGGPRADMAGLYALSNGEYVMPTDKVKRYRPLLDAMRAGVFGMADGGPVGGARADLASARARQRAFQAAMNALEQLRSGVDTARSNVSEARSNVASRGDVLHQQQQVRDLHRQLASRKKGERLTGLDRRAARQDLKDAQRELHRMQTSDDRLAAAERRLRKALADKNEQARKVARSFGTASQEANKLQAAEDRLAKARDTQAALQQRRQGLASGFLDRAGLFTTGATTAGLALQNMRTDLKTGEQWEILLKKLANAGLDKGLLKQFIAEGPSDQSLALGRSILDSGKIGAFNRTYGQLSDQARDYGRMAAQPGKLEMVHIEHFHARGDSVDEIAEKLWYKTKVRR